MFFIKAVLQRIQKLWIQGEDVIVVRALGAAIPRAINLCLQTKAEHYDSVELDVSTSTVTLVGNYAFQSFPLQLNLTTNS